jgi:hypothetical protein
MSFRKGSRGHRVAGNVFVISKLSLAASAVYLALMKSQVTNVLGGVLTFYLVTTAWLAARRRDGETGMFDWGLLLIALTVGATLVTLGLGAAHSQTGLKYGAPAGLYFIFGSWALLAAAGDIRMLVRAVFLGNNVSCILLGACALRCFSPQGLFSWDSNKCSPLFYAKQTYF